MLTLHVRSRVFPELEDAAQFIKAIIGMYDVFMENKRIKAAQAVANLVEVDSTAAAAAVAAEAAALQADVQVSICCLLSPNVELHIGTHAAFGEPIFDIFEQSKDMLTTVSHLLAFRHDLTKFAQVSSCYCVTPK